MLETILGILGGIFALIVSALMVFVPLDVYEKLDEPLPKPQTCSLVSTGGYTTCGF